MAQWLGTTTTLLEIKAQILGQVKSLSKQKSKIFKPEMDSIVYTAGMSVVGMFRPFLGRPNFYSTRKSDLAFSGTAPNYVADISSLDIADLASCKLFHATLKEIQIEPEEDFNAHMTFYSAAEVGATEGIATISSAIGVSDSSPGGNYGASGMSWTALTNTFAGTMNTPFAITDVGKQLVFRKGGTTYQGKISAFTSTTAVVLSGPLLPATDQVAVDAALVFDSLAVSTPNTLSLWLYSNIGSAPTSCVFTFDRFPKKNTVDADTLDYPEPLIPSIRDLGTLYVARRLKAEPTPDMINSLNTQLNAVRASLGIPQLGA